MLSPKQSSKSILSQVLATSYIEQLPLAALPLSTVLNVL